MFGWKGGYINFKKRKGEKSKDGVLGILVEQHEGVCQPLLAVLAGGFSEIFVEGFHAAIETVTVVTGIEPAYDQHFTRWL